MTVLLAAFAAASGCSDDELVPISEAELPAARERNQCARGYDIPQPYISNNPTPVPYPTPAGDRIRPRLDIPVWPGAIEIDGFKIGDEKVQMFETTSSAVELFDFYEEAFLQMGLVAGGGGYGVAGVSCTFIPYYGGGQDQSLKPRVTITTEYTIRGGEAREADSRPPPGFQGAGRNFAPPAEGKLWFFVITEE